MWVILIISTKSFRIDNLDDSHNSVVENVIEGFKRVRKRCTDRTTALYYKLRDDLTRTLNEETC